MSASKITHHVHSTESPATAPARKLAIQTVADLSDRKLAFFHWREASELLSNIEHKVRDYSEEDSMFDEDEAEEIASAIVKVADHLGHVQAISRESSAALKAHIKLLAAPREGGAK